MALLCKIMACAGAVIGAGFASGRELCEFFSRYGAYSWALIPLSAGAMGLLSFWVMRRGAARRSGIPGKICFSLLWAVTGGAMLSAGGELVSLVLPIHSAYPAGVAATLMAAYALSKSRLCGFGWLGLALAALFTVVCAVMLGLPRQGGVPLPQRSVSGVSLIRAAVCAVCYAGLNAAVGMGVIEKCASGAAKADARVAAAFAAVMAALMLICNAVMLARPEVISEALPMVRLLSRLGVVGFYLGAALLYIALVTTLAAILCSLSGAFSGAPKNISRVLPLVTPLVMSFIGFQGIIAGAYPAIGLICLALIAFARG